MTSGDSTAKGKTYFFDFTTDSSTPSMGWLRLMLPGTCGIIKVENVSSGWWSAYLVRD